MKLSKNAGADKYGYSGYGIAFHVSSQFPLSNGKCGKNVLMFGIDNNFSMHADNKKKDILVLRESSTDELDVSTIKAEAKYSINITKLEKKVC